MPSTYTTNNGIEKIGTGEQSGTWGDTTNLNFDILDQALDGLVTITATDTGSSGSPNTLPITDGSLSDGRNRLIIITDGGDLGGSVYYQLTPADAEKIVFLRNSLSGSQDLILFQGTYNAARDLIVPAGKDVIIKFSGGGTSNAVVAPVFADLSLDAATIASADINGGTIDGVTIGVTSVATVINVDNLKLDGNTLSSTDTNGNVVLAPNGDGDVQLDADTVRVGDSNNDVTITTNGTGDLTLNTNGGTDSGSIEIQDGANTNIIVTANGTGKLELANGDITTSAASGSDAAGQDLTIQAGASTGNAAGGDMIFQTTPAGVGSGSVLNSYTTVLTLTDDSKMQIGTSTAVDSVLDEDDMNSDSATALATQQSIKAYVDSQVGTVDTWSEVLANGNTSGATDAVITAGQKITTDTIEETTADAGVKVDTFTLKDNEVSIDAASGTDQAGTSVTVSSGQGTGTGAGGELLFKVAPAGSTGSSVNALATGMKLDSTKALYVDTINELTSAAGVTIDSVLLKDDVVNATDIETSTISANDGTTAINIADSTGAVDIDTSLNVDGTITGDGLTVDGDAFVNLTARPTGVPATAGALWSAQTETGNYGIVSRASSTDSFTYIGNTGSAATLGTSYGSSGSYLPLDLQTSDNKRLRIAANGDITFYDASGNPSFVYDENAGTTINDNQDARDFTVKSDNNAYMLYVDGTNDKVNIGNASGSYDLNVRKTTAGGDVGFQVSNRDTSQTAGTRALIALQADVDNDGSLEEFLHIRGGTNTNGFAEIVAREGTSLRFQADSGTSIVFNNSEVDQDFRVASQNTTNMLFVDADTDRVGVGTGSPNRNVEVSSLYDTTIRLASTRNTNSWTVGDVIGQVEMYSADGTSPTASVRASVAAVVEDTSGASTGLAFRTYNNTERMRITSSGELQLDSDSAFNTDSTATSATTQTAVYSFSATDYTRAKFLVCVTDSTATERYITEILVTHDGSTAVSTEYGQVATDTALATFDVDISGGNVRLLATPASTNSMTFKVMSTQLLA